MDGGRGEGGVEEDWRGGADGEIVYNCYLEYPWKLNFQNFCLSKSVGFSFEIQHFSKILLF